MLFFCYDSGAAFLQKALVSPTYHVAYIRSNDRMCMSLSSQSLAQPSPTSPPVVGTPAWLESTILEHYRGLYQYALSLSRQEADAADLTQQTASIFAQKWADIREADKVKSWLYTTLYREFTRLYRHRQKATPLTPTMAEPHYAAPQSTEIDSQIALRALHSMDEPHRSVLSLYYLEDLSYREIAEVLELPIGTVMSRLSRAKQSLRQILTPTE
jgi:RNA polymerase sigma-70 factor (ECF subfamily)